MISLIKFVAISALENEIDLCFFDHLVFADWGFLHRTGSLLH